MGCQHAVSFTGTCDVCLFVYRRKPSACKDCSARQAQSAVHNKIPAKNMCLGMFTPPPKCQLSSSSVAERDTSHACNAKCPTPKVCRSTRCLQAEACEATIQKDHRSTMPVPRRDMRCLGCNIYGCSESHHRPLYLCCSALRAGLHMAATAAAATISSSKAPEEHKQHPASPGTLPSSQSTRHAAPAGPRRGLNANPKNTRAALGIYLFVCLQGLAFSL